MSNVRRAVGDRKGKLVILEILDHEHTRIKTYRCLCDCGVECKFNSSRFALARGGQCSECYAKHIKHDRAVKWG